MRMMATFTALRPHFWGALAAALSLSNVRLPAGNPLNCVALSWPTCEAAVEIDPATRSASEYRFRQFLCEDSFQKPGMKCSVLCDQCGRSADVFGASLGALSSHSRAASSS